MKPLYNIISKTRIIGVSLLCMLMFAPAKAQDNAGAGYFLTSPSLVRNGSLLTVGIDFDFNDLSLKSDQAAVFTPLVVAGGDTISLTPVAVYGKRAWIQHQRGILKTVGPDNEIALKYKKDMAPVAYEQHLEFTDGLQNSYLMVKKDFYGCAGCNEGESLSEMLVAYSEPLTPEMEAPQLLYMAAIDEGVKVRELSGRAYVDFPVNKIVIYPEYRNNTYELGKIIATIDSVKNDPDITVTSIHIAGTASPEGPYDNNVYLAKNRTIALKEYVTNLYKFPKDFIQTDYDPVDWKGLREWLENNNIAHKDEILAIVNSNIEPYARNSKIKTDFPKEYEWLLRNVYPALRHSDYLIQYQIREFTNIAEIAEIIKTKPQKLSLSEMYRLAAALPAGSEEYNEVFEIAVRMYPEDEIANLNAANNALSRGDLNYAERYLAKAGDSPRAVYARGILKGMQGNYEEGLTLLEVAKASGLEGTDVMIERFKAILGK
ncbi:MAG: DUF3868 domain-containing protein [Muribaculaceae bacterium]|nr:DUF3868 domain-containing protein [Muribaculaceae bacterium]